MSANRVIGWLASGGRRTTPPTPTPAPPPVGRILWNAEPDAGRITIDEIVVFNATVHIEQMSDGSYFIGVTDAEGHSFSGDIGSRTGRAKVDFTLVESDIPWDEDEQHDRPL